MYSRGSRDQLLHQIAVNICEAEIPAGMPECQPRMIEPQQMQQRRVQVVDMHRLLRGFESKFIGGAMDISAAHAAAGKPHSKSMVIMIAPVDFAGVCSR